MTRRIFLSDFHLQMCADGDSLPSGSHPYHWLSCADIQRAQIFLDYLYGTEVGELILLGDVFDEWVVPHDIVPATIPEISQHPAYSGLLARLRGFGDRLLIMAGNHDLHLAEDTIGEIFPAARWGGAGINSPVYRSGRLRAEHGGAYALFNAPDPLRRQALPLGYFLTRMSASAVRKNGKRIRSAFTLVDNLLELVGPAKLAEAVTDAVAEEAGLSLSSTFKLPAHLLDGANVTVADVRHLYGDLYQEWCERVGPGQAFKAIFAELGMLDDAADRLCKNGGTNIVIFAHSHHATIDKDRWFVDDRIYANTGSVCDGQLTFVETLKPDPDGNAIRVSVNQWTDEGTIVSHGSATL